VVKELKELLEEGIVEKSTSELSSPIVVIKKKDGSNQICVDYRKLNLNKLPKYFRIIHHIAHETLHLYTRDDTRK